VEADAAPGGLVVRIVVTGATGNVGTAVLRALAEAPSADQIVGVARRVPDSVRAAFPWVTWHAADVGVDDLSEAMRDADAVVHLAWQFHPTRRPVDTWRGNVVGSIRTFDAAARARVGIVVHASSVGTYSPGPQSRLRLDHHAASGSPGRSGDHGRDEPVDEEWPTHALPTAAYGRQKSYVERVLDRFETDHAAMRVVRMRSAFVFQRSASPEQRRIFAGPFVPGRLVASGRLPVLPLPRGLRFQAVHADDLAAAYVAALERDVAGAFNVAAPPVIGGAELAEVLGARRTVEVPVAVAERALAAAYRLRVVPAEPGLISLFMSLPVMDTAWARDRLGWQPRHSGLDAVRELLAGLRDPVGGDTPPLDAHAGGPLRLGELASGVGARS
jgi:UDP-glucose 4-epimerase